MAHGNMADERHSRLPGESLPMAPLVEACRRPTIPSARQREWLLPSGPMRAYPPGRHFGVAFVTNPSPLSQ
jgi:hypothetical protein